MKKVTCLLLDLVVKVVFLELHHTQPTICQQHAIKITRNRPKILLFWHRCCCNTFAIDRQHFIYVVNSKINQSPKVQFCVCICHVCSSSSSSCGQMLPPWWCWPQVQKHSSQKYLNSNKYSQDSSLSGSSLVSLPPLSTFLLLSPCCLVSCPACLPDSATNSVVLWSNLIILDLSWWWQPGW